MLMVRRGVVAVVVFTAIWVVMNERLTMPVLLSGIVVAIASLWLTDRMLPGSPAPVVRFQPAAWVGFAVLVCKEVAVATWQMAGTVLRGRATTTQFEIVSDLDDEILLFWLTSAIIVTPGSVATDRAGNRIVVVTCDDDVERAVLTCRRLERGLARIAAARRRKEPT